MADHHHQPHGPHNHILDHAVRESSVAIENSESFTNKIAVLTAVISTIGAVFGYMGGTTQVNSALYKNMAAIKKTEAANQWNYYQAKSNKQSLAEYGLETLPAKREHYNQTIARYSLEKIAIKKIADQLEAESVEWDKKSEREIHLHHRWEQATTVLQVSIALAAITLITRRSWAMWGIYGISSTGIILGLMAALHI
jgi:hypothetical protein